MRMSRVQRAAFNYAASFKWHRNVASTHVTCVQDLVALREATDRVLNTVIVDMYEKGGYTFAEIGEALGVSRQAATKRYLSVTE